MKVHQITEYECEVCGFKYNDEKSALHCEQMPVDHDRGVKVGDLVRITSGDGSGSLARVTRVGVHDPHWGPARYAHTVYLLADVVDSWGSRQLSFDSYEVVK